MYINKDRIKEFTTESVTEHIKKANPTIQTWEAEDISRTLNQIIDILQSNNFQGIFFALEKLTVNKVYFQGYIIIENKYKRIWDYGTGILGLKTVKGTGRKYMFHSNAVGMDKILDGTQRLSKLIEEVSGIMVQFNCDDML